VLNEIRWQIRKPKLEAEIGKPIIPRRLQKLKLRQRGRPSFSGLLQRPLFSRAIGFCESEFLSLFPGATFREDHCRLRVGDATENMSTLHGDWHDFAKALRSLLLIVIRINRITDC
jgi:hypothetical protein